MIQLSGSSYENFAEWLVLGLVVLATMSIGIEPDSVLQDELEVTNLSGTITLATRASMDVLGLEDFDKGATANVNVDVQNIVSADYDIVLEFTFRTRQHHWPYRRRQWAC